MAEESSRAWKDQYMLRLPGGMRDRIKAAAEGNNRSMNAEIVARLEKSFQPPESLSLTLPTSPVDASNLMKANRQIKEQFREIAMMMMRFVEAEEESEQGKAPDKTP